MRWSSNPSDLDPRCSRGATRLPQTSSLSRTLPGDLLPPGCDRQGCRSATRPSRTAPILTSANWTPWSRTSHGCAKRWQRSRRFWECASDWNCGPSGRGSCRSRKAGRGGASVSCRECCDWTGRTGRGCAFAGAKRNTCRTCSAQRSWRVPCAAWWRMSVTSIPSKRVSDSLLPIRP